MTDNLPHPNFETLSAFADGESVGEEVALHVGGCSTCGDIVATVRAIPESLAVRASSDPVRPQQALQAALEAFDASYLPAALKNPLGSPAPSGPPLHLTSRAAALRFRPLRWVGIAAVGAAAALTLAFVVTDRNRDHDQLTDNVALGSVTTGSTGTDRSSDTLVESSNAPPVAGAGADTTVATVVVARPATASTAPQSPSYAEAGASSTAPQSPSDAVRAGPVAPASAKSGPSRKRLRSASSPPSVDSPPEPGVKTGASGVGRKPGTAAAQTTVEAAASPSASGLTAADASSNSISATKRPEKTTKKSKARKKPTVNFGGSSNKITTATIAGTPPANVTTALAATRAAAAKAATSIEAAAPTGAVPSGSSASPFSAPTGDLGDTSTLADLLDNMAARLAPTPIPTAVSSTSSADAGPTTSPALPGPCQSAIEQEFSGPALTTALGRVQGRAYVVAATLRKISVFDAITCTVAQSRSR